MLSSSRLSYTQMQIVMIKEVKRSTPPEDRFVKGRADGDPNERNAPKGEKISQDSTTYSFHCLLGRLVPENNS